MDHSSPQPNVAIWNTINELILLEKDVYRENNDLFQGTTEERELWKTEYRKYLRTKAAKRQELLESLEKGLKSCGADSIEQLKNGQPFVISSTRNTQKNSTEKIKDSLCDQSQQVTKETNENYPNKLACKLDFDTCGEKQGETQQPMQKDDNQLIDNNENMQQLQDLKFSYEAVLLEKNQLENHCQTLQHVIETQNRRLEYYEDMFEKLAVNPKRTPFQDITNVCKTRDALNISSDSNKENEPFAHQENMKNIAESIQQLQQKQYALQSEVYHSQVQKEELEREISSLQEMKKALMQTVQELEKLVDQTEQKKRISLETVQFLARQLQGELERTMHSKFQVTEAAGRILNISSNGRELNAFQHGREWDTCTVTVKALSKLQDELYYLREALEKSQEESIRHKKALETLRKEHEETIRKYSKELQVLMSKLNIGKGQETTKKKTAKNKSPILKITN